MREYFFLFVVALIGSLIVSTSATPLVRALAIRWGAMDKPDLRKIHLAPIPRLGGLAIWIGLWVAALFTARSIPTDRFLAPSSSLPELASIFAGATIILVVGMTDDRRGQMTPLAKLAGQF